MSKVARVAMTVLVAMVAALNRPGESGDSVPWEGWSHVRDYLKAVPA